MTIGSVEPLKQLYATWGERVHFVDILVRQAHPGPAVPPYTNFEQKLHDAERYQQDEAIPWSVLVDDLAGTVHQVYGGLSDPSYLIGSDGRVSFSNLWTHAPTLERAIRALIESGGHGVVEGGINQPPHMFAAFVAGWPALRRGLPQSLIDLETAMPGLGSGLWIGHQLRPLLAPLALRATPLPLWTRLMLVALAGLLLRRAARRRGS